MFQSRPCGENDLNKCLFLIEEKENAFVYPKKKTEEKSILNAAFVLIAVTHCIAHILYLRMRRLYSVVKKGRFHCCSPSRCGRSLLAH